MTCDEMMCYNFVSAMLICSSLRLLHDLFILPAGGNTA